MAVEEKVSQAVEGPSGLSNVLDSWARLFSQLFFINLI